MPDAVTAQEIRDAVMDQFRRWGGQWNVGVARAPDAGWKLVVHSRRVVSATLSDRAADSLVRREGESEGAWAAELRPLFDAAVKASRED